MVAPVGLQQTHFTDEQFTEVLRWRPGCVAAPRQAHCKNFAASTHETCNEPLDGHGDHAVICAHGPLRIKKHNNYTDVLADIACETDAHVRCEACIKEFSTPRADTWPDI